MSSFRSSLKRLLWDCGRDLEGIGVDPQIELLACRVDRVIDFPGSVVENDSLPVRVPLSLQGFFHL